MNTGFPEAWDGTQADHVRGKGMDLDWSPIGVLSAGY